MRRSLLLPPLLALLFITVGCDRFKISVVLINNTPREYSVLYRQNETLLPYGQLAINQNDWGLLSPEGKLILHDLLGTRIPPHFNPNAFQVEVNGELYVLQDIPADSQKPKSTHLLNHPDFL
jgi:hypothetical protein